MHRIHLSTFGNIRIHHNGIPLEALPQSSVHLFALLALLDGKAIAPSDAASRLFPDLQETDARRMLREAQELLWTGFPLSVRLFQGISVQDAEVFGCGMRFTTVPGAISLTSDLSEVRSMLTADWSVLDRSDAVSRLKAAAEIMDRGFLPGISTQWELEDGENLCRMFRMSALSLISSLDLSGAGEAAKVESEPVFALPPFFGRRNELDLLSGYLRGGEKTLTLVGLGGVGKSRLALELLRNLPPQWDNVPVLRISLGNIVTRVGVLETILDSLGKRIGGAFLQGRDTLVTVVQAFQQPTILFLDNVEDAAIAPGGEVVQLLSYLRYRCPELVILCTSRCRVGIPEELVVPVSAFEMPTDGDLAELDPTELRSRFPGLEMVSFALEDACKAGIALRSDTSRQKELLELTGGLPLSIEMLAARTAVSGRLPSSGEIAHGVLSPTGSIEWALSTVSEEATELFYTVSLFADTFTTEAVEGITARSGLGYALAELDDVALLQAVPGDGFLRYRMVPTVRSWAREQLAERGTLLALQEAHARYFADLLEPGVVHTPEKIAPLAAWLSDMVAATEFYLQSGLLARASSTADNLGQLFRLTGRYDIGIDLMRRLLSALESVGNAPERCFAEVRDCLGRLLVNAKGNSEAVEHLEYAIGFWIGINDTLRIARASNNLGLLFDRSCQFNKAEYYYGKSLEMFTSLGNNVAICSLTLNIASLNFEKQDWEAAREWLLKSLHISEDVLGDDIMSTTRLMDLVEAEYLLGNHAEALKYCRRVLRILGQSRNMYRMSQLSILAGLVSFDSGKCPVKSCESIVRGLEYMTSQNIEYSIVDSIIKKSQAAVKDMHVKILDFGFDPQYSCCETVLSL